jgi:hypothetical protein
MKRILEVYVAPGCWGCDIAHGLVEGVRALALPGLQVRLIDLTAPDVVRPPIVTAVPTYVLDGRLLSRGNPDERELVHRLQSASETA